MPTAKAAPKGAGDTWTWTAIEADNKLIVSSLVGRPMAVLTDRSRFETDRLPTHRRPLARARDLLYPRHREARAGRCGPEDEARGGTSCGIKEEIALLLPRPRGVEVLTSLAFVAFKRRVMGQIREEAMRAMAEAAHHSGAS